MSFVRRTLALPAFVGIPGYPLHLRRAVAITADRGRLRRWALVAVFTLLSGQSFFHLAAYHHDPTLLLAWPVLAILSLRWPLPAIFLATAVLRVGFSPVCCTDQIVVSQSAWERVIAGQGGPYGVGYATTDPPGSPFPYGPLGLMWWLPGPAVELIAVVAVMLILARQRAFVTLAVVAVWEPSVWLTLAGVNDYSPGLLILVALLVLRSHPIWGAALLAVAAALKPYAFAWFLPAIGYGGLGVAAALIGLSAVLWSPLFLLWGGPGKFLETVRMASAVHAGMAPNAINMPMLRWIAVPLALVGLGARRWEWAVLAGSAVFLTFLYFDRWASYSYALAVIPAAGLALESLLWLPRHDPRGSPEPDEPRDRVAAAPVRIPGELSGI
jgi:hypothetical protein